MNNEDLMKLADQAGMGFAAFPHFEDFANRLTIFASLVSAEKDKKIADLEAKIAQLEVNK